MGPPSRLRRFWDAIKPPPPVPHRDIESTERSFFKELLKVLRPPPPLTPIDPRELRRRRRMMAVSAAIVVVAAASGGVYFYIKSAPTRAAGLYREGLGLMAAGNYKVATQRFTEAVRIWPNLAEAYYQRGLALQSLHDADGALADFQRAVNVNPSLAAAHVAIGSIYNLRGNPEGAMSEFNVAIKGDSSVESYYQRGQAREAQGDYQKAIEDYNTAISLRPDAPYVYSARAAVREKVGDRAGASQDREKARELEFHGFPQLKNP